ncbi:MAG: glycerate kinase, partial [Solibacillus sp.]
MNILISPDSFKGTLSASEAADSIEKGIKRALPNCKTEKLPIADGGEGTMEALVSATNGHFVHRIVHDPLHRPHEATYGVLGNNHTCVIEMAQASGITLLHNSEKQPHIASSVGTGELIQHALNDGYRDYIICIGGSATNDGGVGMLRALGLRLNDEAGSPVEASIFGLQRVASLDFSTWDSRIADSRFIVA